MKIQYRWFAVAILLLLTSAQGLQAAGNTLTLGFNIPLSGALEAVGVSSKNAAELVRLRIEQQGGLTIGGTTYSLTFLYGDNTSDNGMAPKVAIEQVTQGEVIAIIGPQASNNAIPVGQMADSFKTPMVSPWSTAPKTTKDRPYVFRIPFLLDKVGEVGAQFAKDEFGATKGAVLFDVVSAYPRALAKSFRDAFEALNGPGSLVAFEEFRTGDKDFHKQIQRIKASGAQVLFIPQYYNEIPLIIRQLKEAGLDVPILGSDSWAGGDLMAECGADCHGRYFIGNYAAGGAKGVNKEFVDQYQKAHGVLPDEPAALTYDAVNVVVKALQNTGGLTGNLMEDRTLLKDQLVNLKNYEGVTGMMSFNASGDPEKCVQIIKIDDSGVFMQDRAVCP
jgi:branched-chain amino acid transport system substrate-binding protein